MINCSNVIKNIADVLFDPAIHLYELFPQIQLHKGRVIYTKICLYLLETHISFALKKNWN